MGNPTIIELYALKHSKIVDGVLELEKRDFANGWLARHIFFYLQFYFLILVTVFIKLEYKYLTGDLDVVYDPLVPFGIAATAAILIGISLVHCALVLRCAFTARHRPNALAAWTALEALAISILISINLHVFGYFLLYSLIMNLYCLFATYKGGMRQSQITRARELLEPKFQDKLVKDIPFPTKIDLEPSPEH